MQHKKTPTRRRVQSARRAKATPKQRTRSKKTTLTVVRPRMGPEISL